MVTEDFILKEKQRQDSTIELIASENFVSQRVMDAAGSCLTNKYAEGYPNHRYYGGCQVVDELETYCQEQWKKVFNTDYHVNVQPYSGSIANQAAMMSVCKPGDRVLSMSLNDGGHLTHGAKVSFSGKLYEIYNYNLDDSGKIDLKDLVKKTIELRPRLLIVGASAYSRFIEYDKIYPVVKEVSPDTVVMVDMAHVAGLIAGGVHPSPFGYADIITTTTQKTLRGTRGGLIFCKEEFAKRVDKAVFPGCQGGPLMHIIAAKAVTAEEAQTEEFKQYAHNVVENARVMAESFSLLGMEILTGGTDNHMFLLNLTNSHPHVTGKMAQDTLDKIGISLNKNMIHNDSRKPDECSGLRIGTAAMTTKGYTTKDFMQVALKIKETLDELELEQLRNI